MEPVVGRGDLRGIASVLSELCKAVLGPSRKSITACDAGHVRRIAYIQAGPDGDGMDPDIIRKVAKRARGEVRISVTKTSMVVLSGGTRFKLRPMLPPPYMDEPAAAGTGEVTIPADEMCAALEDVRASGASSVAIAVDKGDALFRGEGASDCRITVNASASSGMGYSRLDLDLLLPCMRGLDGRAATIPPSPKGATAMRFGDDLLYHQGAQT